MIYRTSNSGPEREELRPNGPYSHSPLRTGNLKNGKLRAVLFVLNSLFPTAFCVCKIPERQTV
jgi:hypothetical protein